MTRDIDQIQEVRNVGWKTVEALRSYGVSTLEELASLGEWEFKALDNYRIQGLRRHIYRHLTEECGLDVKWSEWPGRA